MKMRIEVLQKRLAQYELGDRKPNSSETMKPV